MKTSSEDYYFMILERLANAGVEQKIDISDIIVKYLDHTHINWVSARTVSEDYLSNMLKVKHIGFVNITPQMMKRSTDYVKVSAWITAEGLLFYYQKLQIDTVLQSNLLSKKNIKATLILATLTLLLSLSTAFLSIYNNGDKEQIFNLNKRIAQQNHSLTQLNVLLHQKSNQILDSLNIKQANPKN